MGCRNGGVKEAFTQQIVLDGALVGLWARGGECVQAAYSPVGGGGGQTFVRR